MTKLIYTLLLFALPVLLFGQDAQTFAIIKNSEARMNDASVNIYELDKEVLNEIYNLKSDNLNLEIPFNDESLSLELERVYPFGDAGVKVRLASGKNFIYDQGKYFRGTVDGENYTSLVLHEDFVIINFEIEDGGWSFERIAGKDYQYELKKSKEATESDMAKSCGVQTADFLQEPTQQLEGEQKSATVPAIDLFFELDHIYFLTQGQDAAIVTANIMVDFLAVQQLYETGAPGSFSLDVNLSGLFIWDIQDPYPLSSLDQRLDAFIATRTVFAGDIAVLIHRGTHVSGGIAEIDLSDTSTNMCGNGSGQGPYCVASQGAYGASYRAYIISHEVGHVLGGRHVWECRFGPNGNHPISDGCESIACGNSQLDLTNNQIMGYCLYPDFASYTISFWTGEIISDNLCGLDPNCLYDENTFDNDNDGVASIDDCDDFDPYVPGIVGTPCDDNDPNTINDVIIGTPNQTSCKCEGEVWENDPVSQNCNLILGGTVDFQSSTPGRSNLTIFRGLMSDWTGLSTGDVFCEGGNRFGGFLAKNTATGSLWEGLTVELSHPIPRNRGRFEISYDYYSIHDQPYSVFLQGSDTFGNGDWTVDNSCLQNSNNFCFDNSYRPMEPSCVGSNSTFVYAQLDTDPNTCDSDDFEWCHSNPPGAMRNTGLPEVNFIHLSTNPTSGTIDELGILLLDNINVEIFHQSYFKAQLWNRDCELFQIRVDDYCDGWELQEMKDGEWVAADVDIPAPDLVSPLTTHDLTLLRWNVGNRPQLKACTKYRIHQLCGPCSFDKSSNPLEMDDCGCEIADPILECYGPDEAGGDLVGFTSAECQVENISWFLNGNLIEGENDIALTNVEAGWYHYTVQNGNCEPFVSEGIAICDPVCPTAPVTCSCDCVVDFTPVLNEDGTCGVEYVVFGDCVGYTVDVDTYCDGLDWTDNLYLNVIQNTEIGVTHFIDFSSNSEFNGCNTYSLIPPSNSTGCNYSEEIDWDCNFCECYGDIYTFYNGSDDCESVGYSVYGSDCENRKWIVEFDGGLIADGQGSNEDIFDVDDYGTAVLTIFESEYCDEIVESVDVTNPCIEEECECTPYIFVDNNNCVVTYGGSGDCEGYWGYIVVYDECEGNPIYAIQGSQGPAPNINTLLLNVGGNTCIEYVIFGNDESCPQAIAPISCGGDYGDDDGGDGDGGGGYGDGGFGDGGFGDAGSRELQKEDKGINFTITPNPADDIILLDLTKYEKVKEIQILDIQGKVHYLTNDIIGQTMEIDVNNLISGLYVVVVSSDTEVKIEKLVIN